MKLSVVLKLILSQLILLHFSGCNCKAPETVGEGDASGIPTILLTNAAVEVRISPQIGRIIDYRLHGKDNMLWVNPSPMMTKIGGWINYGGSRVWLSPEGRNQMKVLGQYWPPDNTSDGRPWKILEHTDKKLVMATAVSPYHGLRVTQSIELIDDTSLVRICYRFCQVRDMGVVSHIWPVTQVKLPEYFLLNCLPEYPERVQRFQGEWPEQYLQLSAKQQVAKFNWPTDTDSKIGTPGSWVACVYTDTAFVQSTKFIKNATYSDKSNCEIYVDPKGGYAEMELLGPLRKMTEGQSCTLEVTWMLLEKRYEDSSEMVVEMINRSIEQK